MLLIKRLFIACVALYYGLTLLVITPALNFLPGWYVEKHYGRTLETGFVILNPFKLSLDVASAALSETSGERFLSLGETSVNLSVASLWQQGWVLDELKVHDLAVKLVRFEDETFNFSNLLPPESAEPVDEPPAEIPAITLSLLDIQAREITLTDQTRSKPYQSQWSGLAIRVEDLSTVFEDGKPYTLALTGPQGGTLNWQGTISIPNSHSEGTLSIDGLSLVNLWHLAEPWVAFEIAQGRLDVSGTYNVNWGEALAYSLEDGAVALRELSVIPGSGVQLEDTSVQLKQLSVNTISATSKTQHASVGLIDIDGLNVNGWSEGTRASVVDMLLGQQLSSDEAPATVTDMTATAEPDRATTENVEVAQGIESPSTGAEANSATTQSESESEPLETPPVATLDSKADIDPNTPTNSLADNAGDAGMEQAKAALTATVSDDGTPSAGPSQPATPDETAAWTVEVGKVALRNSAVNWRSEYTDPPELAITPINASIERLQWPLEGDSPFTFAIAVNEITTVTLDGSINPELGDGSINFALAALPLPMFNPNLPKALHATITDGRVGVSGTATLQAFAPGTITAEGAIEDFATEVYDTENVLTGWDNVSFEALAVDMNAQTVKLKELRIDGYQGRLHIFEDGSINASKVWRAELAEAEGGEQVAGTSAAETTPQAAEESSQPWDIDVRSVIVNESNIDFMDQSLPIAFRTIIGDINGAIKNLNSDAAESADVDIKGSVDKYAPVALLGTMNPLATPMSIDLNLTFEGVDMALLSPYSSTYAGYEIESGLLDLDLTYALEDVALKGLNKVRLDKLKLGKKIASEKAIDAPLELALSILTDANGVIDVKVPVAGNVDDPSFQLGGVIVKAFIGLFTKVITAPFSILASLVGSEEDLRQLTFPVGSAVVDESTQLKLNDIAEILRQRPKIDLALTGRVNPAADRDRLQKNALDAALLEDGLSAASLSERDEDWERAVNKRFAAIGGDPNDELLSIRDKRLRVAKSIDISDEQLNALAQERAAAVKTYLVTEAQIDVERMVIQKGDIKDKEHRYNGVQLDID